MLNFLGALSQALDLSAEGEHPLRAVARDARQAQEDVIDVFWQTRDPVLEELFDAYKYRTKHVEVRIDPQMRPRGHGEGWH
jgi:hypothetical protein